MAVLTYVRYGDTPDTLAGAGGAQKLKGATGYENFLYGDAGLIDHGIGGSDTLIGGKASLAGTVNSLIGDAGGIIDGFGGNDVVRAKPGTLNYLYGDALDIGTTAGGTSHGGQDLIGGARNAEVFAYGDAYTLSGSAAGGNDVLRGSNAVGPAGSAANTLHGDAFQMVGSAVRGGDDKLFGGNGDAVNFLYGDAYQIAGDAGGALVACGNDTLKGGEGADNTLYGDAANMGVAAGGNDRLTGGSYGATNVLYGDGYFVQDGTCGNDTLVGGKDANDAMWGDALLLSGATGGADIFRFVGDGAFNIGADTIWDFEPGKDRIDLKAFAGLGIHGIADLTILLSGGDSVIDFGGGNTITVKDAAALSAADFLFA